MKIDLFDIIHYLEFKDIALVGNASSILNSYKDIDKHEVVCRINRGIPRGNERCMGHRTDILFTATKVDKYLDVFNAKYILWTTADKSLVTNKIEELAYRNPPEDWEAVKAKCPADKLPSTGLVAIEFLIKNTNFKSLTLYGFDSFASGTFYHNNNNQPWHSPLFEKEYLEEIIKNNKNIVLVQ